ncbi:cytochrome P450 [Streptomyces racemochromogenes]|uniref:cytochrome P450 n=1 Tax=Streptomyces racemochromogenes TaxID=67353 RepID=UPI0031F0789E
MSPLIDSTVPLLTQGYAWAPDLRRRHGDPPAVRTRLMGRPALLLHGPAAVDFFYDERHVLRDGALPGPVLDTLFGRGAVHTLDGERHRVRKALFVSLLMRDGSVDRLTTLVRRHWAAAVDGWEGRGAVLFDEAATVLARAVCDWTGLAVPEDAAREIAEDCVAMVDGFATPGPRHWRARRARARQEESLARTVEELRGGVTRLHQALPPGGGNTALEAVARHRDADGRLLDPRTAAVELLNVIRPCVAVAWFVAFAAHALHRRPRLADALRADDGAYARAFAHEVRRFYPFVPFVGGLAARDLRFGGQAVPEGTLVLLDVYGHHHDPALWPDPYRFDPLRFLGREPGPGALIPQGGGDARTGHRCPGEDITVGLLAEFASALAGLDTEVPEQDLRIPLHRIPTRPRSGFTVSVPSRQRSHHAPRFQSQA